MRTISKSRLVICIVCKNNFYANHSQAKYCNPICTRIGARKSWVKYAKNNIEKRKNNSHNHYENNKEKRTQQIKIYQSTEKGRLSQKIATINSKNKYPEKYMARQEVLIAKRKGVLIKKSCEKCGNTIVHAHHINYSEPLNVVWLCINCHIKEHE